MSSEVGETFSFESSALNGLRGFAAIHILIYHSVIYSSWGFQTYGQVSRVLLILFFHLIEKFPIISFYEHKYILKTDSDTDNLLTW